MNRQPSTIVELEDNDFEEIGRPRRPEDERAVRLVVSFLEGIAGERMLDCVNDVVIRDAMLTRRIMDLHTGLV